MHLFNISYAADIVGARNTGIDNSPKFEKKEKNATYWVKGLEEVKGII